MNKAGTGKNIFADKATFVARKMLSHPGRKWVIRDFTGENGVSLGMAHGVLEAMAKKGYIERVKRGPDSFALLTNARELVRDWISVYRFEVNDIHTYYSPDKNILPKLRDCLKDTQYALTLHSGANLITSFVVTDHVYVYFSPESWKKQLLDLRQRLDLKELVRGGNVHIVHPLYKHSVFYNTRTIKGYRVVSNLQLYLDLYNFKPRGREHAEYLTGHLKEKGIDVYES